MTLRRHVSAGPTYDLLKEKYYHSQAHLLLIQRNLDKALALFERALSVRETPYCHHQLALALEQKGEVARALLHLGRAIEMRPSVPEYYYERSMLNRKMGDRRRAAADRDTSIHLDSHYVRIGRIRTAARRVNRAVGRGNTGMALENLSCPVSSCPAYCCHFTGPMILHGACFGAWKLSTVRNLLAEMGIQERRSIETFSPGDEPFLRHLIRPDHFLVEGRRCSVFYPKRAKRCRELR